MTTLTIIFFRQLVHNLHEHSIRIFAFEYIREIPVNKIPQYLQRLLALIREKVVTLYCNTVGKESNG